MNLVYRTASGSLTITDRWPRALQVEIRSGSAGITVMLDDYETRDLLIGLGVWERHVTSWGLLPPIGPAEPR